MIVGDNSCRGQNLLRVVVRLTVLGLTGFLSVLILVTQLYAQSPPVVLDAPVDRLDLIGHIDAFEDPDWQYEGSSILSDPTANFQEIQGKTANFGYTQSKIWLKTRLQNVDSESRDWVVHFHENFKQVFDVDLIHEDGRHESLMSLRPDSPFSARDVDYPQMVAAFSLDPNETATLLISLWSEGSSYITYSFETPDSFARVASRQSAKNYMFYGMMMLLIAVATVSLIVFRRRVFFLYSSYALCVVLYVMHADGVTFQYLWPNAPRLNNYASVMTGTGLIVFGALFARSFLRTRERHVAMDRLLLGVIILTLCCVAILLPTSPQILKKTLVFLSLVAVLSFTISAIVAAIHRFREVRFYLLAWIGALISAVMLNLSHLLGIEISQDFLHDSIRMVMVFDAFMMGLAIADRYNQLRQSQQFALERSLQDSQRNLKLNSRLSELETQYSVASDLANVRNEQMQNAVHDLSQPLHALRLSVSNLTSGRLEDPESVQNIDQTFTYLENLVAKQLQAPLQEIETDEISEEEMTTQNVLASVHQMFSADALAKGLEFRFIPTRFCADVEPIVLMRITSNLVSNAIKYTERGGVLLGCRRRNGVMSVEVHDTGRGLTSEQFAEACLRSVRLDEHADSPKGHGYGLSIVRELVDKKGFRLRLSGLRRSGTGIVVDFPVQKKTSSIWLTNGSRFTHS